MMKKEKYIQERHSSGKDKQNELYAFDVYIPYTQGGKRMKYYKSFKIKDYTNANAAKKAAIRERDRMMPILAEKKEKPVPAEYTVNQLFELVPVYYPRTKNTIIKNTKVFEKHIKPFYGDWNIKSVKLHHVQQTLNNAATYCVQQTVRNVKTDWHRIFQVAISLSLDVTDWTQVIDPPRASKVTERSLSEQNITEEDFSKFCSFMSQYGGYMPTEYDRIYNRDIILYMMKLMRITGIRLQEVRCLSRDCFSFQTFEFTDDESGETTQEEIVILSIKHSAGSTFTEENTVRATKTPWSVRKLPIVESGVGLIREILKYSKHDLVFAKWSGEMFTSTEVSDYLNRVGKKYRKVTGEQLYVYATLMRKSFTSDAYRAGVSPAVVKKMMGHRYETTSVNWYANASDEELIEAIKNRKFKTRH